MEKQRWEESERRRVEERRSEKRKSEKKEDAGAGKGRKVTKTCVFPMICGSGGSKSRLAEAAGVEPCGQMRDEKLHAVVARSTFASQNVQNTPTSDHFLQNPHVFLTFDKVHNPLRLPRKTTSARPKVLRTLQFFALLTSTCASRNTAYTFSTPQLPKVVRSWCALYILTWTCASPHNGVHFFDISTSKSCPRMVCFVHFDIEMCLAPQQHALFRHLNFQQWSDVGVLCTF